MKVCSYFGNLYMDSFVHHVQEMKDKGFDTLLFAITETDMKFNLEIFKEFREYAEEQGMETWATFWGFKGVGEAVTTGKVGLIKWIAEVEKIGFSHIMVDELKEQIYNTCFQIALYFKHLHIHLCLCDDTFNKLSDFDLKQMPVQSIGVSCYMLGHTDWRKLTDRTEAICNRLQRIRPDDNFIFIQAFDIPSGYELIPPIVKEQAVLCGIKNFGVWGFRATAATGNKRPDNPKAVWRNVSFN